jgi:hypothetical protein
MYVDTIKTINVTVQIDTTILLLLATPIKNTKRVRIDKFSVYYNREFLPSLIALDLPASCMPSIPCSSSIAYRIRPHTALIHNHTLHKHY